MTETRTVRDPFLGKDVEVSDDLVDRLRGRYAQGPTMPNGEPEFGWRQFPTPPIQQAAADEIERLNALLAEKRSEPPREWRVIETVADLVNNLLTLDQTLPAWGAYHVKIDGQSVARVRGVSLSREHVSNNRILTGDQSVPWSLVIWTGADERGASS